MTRDDAIRIGRELDEEELAPAEFERRVRETLADEEDFAGRLELIRWFTRRYATAGERLAYARRKMRQLRDSPLRWPFDGV